MGKIITFWKDKIIGKNEHSPAFRKQLANRINGSQLKYVSERIDNTETVLCHKAVIVSTGDELIISSPDKGSVFRAKIVELSMNELLSKEGIILTGKDLEHDEKERSVVAYYTYYRKIDNE